MVDRFSLLAFGAGFCLCGAMFAGGVTPRVKSQARAEGYADAVDSVLIEHMQRGTALDMVRAGGLPFDLTVYNARRDSVVCVVRVVGAR